MATAERATKNLALELQRFSDFSRDVLVPVLVDLQLADTKFRKQVNFTATHIGEVYGHSISKAFAMMFKKVAKYRQDENGKRSGSAWVPYDKALHHFAIWLEATGEKTGRSLLKYLEEKGCQEMEWSSDLKCWVTKEFADKAREFKALTKQEEDDLGIDYNELRKSLLNRKKETA